MWKVRLLDKAAYQTAVEALDAFERGDPSLLTPLVERCLAMLRSEPANPYRLWQSSNPIFADMLEEAIASRDMEDLAHIVIACTAMPDYQDGSGLRMEDDSPNLVDFGEDDAGLYGALCDVAPWVAQFIIERFRHTERYSEGMSMFLFRREDLVRLQEGLRKVVPGPGSRPNLAQVRDRFLDLIARCLADDRTAISLSNYG